MAGVWFFVIICNPQHHNNANTVNCQGEFDNKVNFVCLHNKLVVFLVFYENYVRLCNSVGKTPSAVALEIGIAKPTVTRWRNGSKPNKATEIKVADYFGVHVSELTGEGQKNSPLPDGEGLSDLEYIRSRLPYMSKDDLALLMAELPHVFMEK